LKELKELQEFRSSGVQETGDRRQETGDRRQETGDSVLEDVDKKSQGNWSVETVMHPLP
jgi:hypothetical protein